MGLPVKISDELVAAAQHEAGAAGRSTTKQIEHWAEIGRVVETLLRVPQVLALKRAGADSKSVLAAPEARAAISAVIDTLAEHDREDILAYVHDTGRPVYAAAPGRAGFVVQVQADGKRILGRMVNRKFVPSVRAR